MEDERSRAAEAEENDANRALFDEAPAALALLDERGSVLRANRAAHALGVDIELLAADPGRTDTEVRAVDASGRARVFAIDETRPFGRSGQRILCLRDVTDRAALEDELSHLRRVESIGFVTASVVHDFNNLLTPIVCTSALLTHALGDESLEGQMAAEIRMAAERAAGLVRQVLRLARRHASTVQRVDVNAAISEMKWLATRVVREGIDVSFELGAAPLDVMVDRDQLEQALLNLIANSRDAIPDGGRITVTTSSISFADEAPGSRPGDGYVSIAVVDTGTGMQPDVRERIFDSFFTTKEEGSGTGLGLASVRRFVNKSGGCVSVRSGVGQGTTVVLYLPTAPAPDATAFGEGASSAPESSPAGGAGPGFRGELSGPDRRSPPRAGEARTLAPESLP